MTDFLVTYTGILQSFGLLKLRPFLQSIALRSASIQSATYEVTALQFFFFNSLFHSDVRNNTEENNCCYVYVIVT